MKDANEFDGAPERAQRALICSLIGVLLLGFILGPAAIVMGRSAGAELRREGRAGTGTATAAFVLGILATVIGLGQLTLILYNILSGRYPPGV